MSLLEGDVTSTPKKDEEESTAVTGSGKKGGKGEKRSKRKEKEQSETKVSTIHEVNN